MIFGAGDAIGVVEVVVVDVEVVWRRTGECAIAAVNEFAAALA